MMPTSLSLVVRDIIAMTTYSAATEDNNVNPLYP